MIHLQVRDSSRHLEVWKICNFSFLIEKLENHLIIIYSAIHSHILSHILSINKLSMFINIYKMSVFHFPKDEGKEKRKKEREEKRNKIYL